MIFLENGALIQVSRYYMRRAFGPPHSVSKLEGTLADIEIESRDNERETHLAIHEKHT